MTINIIVAVSDNGVIGKDGKIPWKLSTDLARFKEITTGHNLIMGRKTYESLPKPLENREILVLSATYGEHSGDREIRPRHRWHQALHITDVYKDEQFFVAGGQQIYDEIFKTPELIHRVYLTRVHCNVEGDAFFEPPVIHVFPMKLKKFNSPHPLPARSDIRWEKISEEFIPKSDKDEYDSTFQVWENRSE